MPGPPAGTGPAGAGPEANGLLVHDMQRDDPSYAFALSRLDSEDFAQTPIGIFRKVEHPRYDTLMTEQIETATADQGIGDLSTLLVSGDTWQIG